MKKICFLIVFILFFTPMNIYASDAGSDSISETIKFEDIEEKILENSPMVKINKNALSSMEENYDLLDEIDDDLDDNKEDLDDAIDSLELQIQKLQKDRASLETKIDGDQELVNHIKLNYDALIGIYEYNKASLKWAMKLILSSNLFYKKTA